MSNDATPGAEHQIVAMFDSYAEARDARDQLVNAGVPTSAMDLLDRNAEASDTNFSYERTDEGFWGAIKRLFVPESDAPGYVEGVRRGHALLVVRPPAGTRDQVFAALERMHPVDLDDREAQWRSGGWTAERDGAGGAADRVGAAMPVGSGFQPGYGEAQTAQAASSDAASDAARAERQAPYGEQQASYSGRGAAEGVTAAGRSGEQVIPVVEEQLRVGKRDVSSGSARIRSYVIERPVEEQVRLREEHVQVERRPVNEPTGTVPDDAFRERSFEVTATSEEAVIAKEARIVEEVVVRKDVGERTETVSDTVRRTEVEVDQGDDVSRTASSEPLRATRPDATRTDTTRTGTTTPGSIKPI